MTSLSWRSSNKLATLAMLFMVAIIIGIFLSRLWNSASPQIPLAAGETTVFNRTSTAYEQPSAGLTEANFDKHGEGDIAFEAVFVTSPARVNPGLGPLFNNASCAGCHIRNGRGLPEKGQMLVRVSDPQESNLDSNTVPLQYQLEDNIKQSNTPSVPGLGTQIQDQAIYGYQPEAAVEMNWQEVTERYGDGTTYQLRSPEPKITLANGESLSPEIQISPRIPSPVFGIGLLEAIPNQTLEKLADPEDKDGDGISGRLNQVWDVQTKSTAIGKFGWKAGHPTLLQQSASAYVNDMGVTNPLFTEPDGSADIDEEILDNANFYVQTLAVPARTLTKDSQVQRGETLFNEANCAACHISTLKTGKYEVKELSYQTIYPYTDLLLHDMGEGLADNRPEFLATGTEWRTPPLWGIGLTHTVLPYSSFLHDGRARTLEEAILWHGGEAEASREAFRNLSADNRAALVKFLRSL
ncbi:MAG: di-heme oxidoredictase family protein [Xenococcaceae cyanobacterium MO_188.B29]|nr:di-heme oxidoredictase family protein [Xenococcaceae cyanobacterium MO_188.B29]